MSDLPPPRSAQELHLADREGRKVVVQHEALVGLPVDQLDLLLVVGRAERSRDERLGLAAREHRRPVGVGQHADVRGDVADLIEGPTVETAARIENLVAQDLLFQVLEHHLGVRAAIRIVVGNGREQVVERPIDLGIALELVLDAHGVGERGERLRLDFLADGRIHVLGGDVRLRLSDGRGHRLDRVDDVSNGRVARLESAEHDVLAHLPGSRFDHYDRGAAAGDDEIEVALLAFRIRRVDHERPVEQADTDRGDGVCDGNGRYGEGGRRAGQGEHVGIVFGIGGQEQRDNLCLPRPSVGKQRPKGPVDEPARQNLLLGRFAFPLEETAGDPAGGVGVLPVVDRERQEVDALARGRSGAGRDDDEGVAVAHGDGAVRLFGQLAGLDREGGSADFNLGRVHGDGLQFSGRLMVPARCAERRAAVSSGPVVVSRLLADAEPLDQVRVSLGILAFEVVEEATTPTDELQQATT